MTVDIKPIDPQPPFFAGVVSGLDLRGAVS